MSDTKPLNEMQFAMLELSTMTTIGFGVATQDDLDELLARRLIEEVEPNSYRATSNGHAHVARGDHPR